MKRNALPQVLKQAYTHKTLTGYKFRWVRRNKGTDLMFFWLCFAAKVNRWHMTCELLISFPEMEKGQQGSESIKIILDFFYFRFLGFFSLIQKKQIENIFSSSPSLGTICLKVVSSKYVMYLSLLVQQTICSEQAEFCLLNKNTNVRSCF